MSEQEEIPAKRAAFEPAERLLEPTPYDPGMKRPGATIAGAVMVLLRVAAGVIWTVSASLVWHDWLVDLGVDLAGVPGAEEISEGLRALFISTNGIVLALNAILAIFIFFGHNWARVIIMLLAAGSISLSFVDWWVRGQDITLTGTFLSLGLDILILLALSSRNAAAYARRKQRR